MAYVELKHFITLLFFYISEGASLHFLKYFYKTLKEFRADRQALDATRILRVSGSINSKTNTEVKIIDEYNYLYDLRKIQNQYMLELSEKASVRRGRTKKGFENSLLSKATGHNKAM